MIGSLLGGVARLINVPIRAAENVLMLGEADEEDRFLSKPLDTLAEELEKVDKPDKQ